MVAIIQARVGERMGKISTELVLRSGGSNSEFSLGRSSIIPTGTSVRDPEAKFKKLNNRIGVLGFAKYTLSYQGISLEFLFDFRNGGIVVPVPKMEVLQDSLAETVWT